MANDFNEDINLIDELAAPTKERVASPTPSEFEQKEISVNLSDFTPSAMVSDEEPSEPSAPAQLMEEPIEDVPRVSPEESAESIIDIINVASSTIFIPLIGKKLRNKFGSDVMENAKEALLKELADPTSLSDDEKVLISKYNRFKAIMKETSGKIPFSDEEIQQLRPSTIRLCAKHGIQVNENIAFGANIIKVMGTRIVDIVTL